MTLASPAKAFNLAGLHCGFVVLPAAAADTGAAAGATAGVPAGVVPAGVRTARTHTRTTSIRDAYMSVVEHAALHYGSAFATVAMLAAYEEVGSDAWLELPARAVRACQRQDD